FIYSKLRFGNVILVDFFDSSVVLEESMILNWPYMLCSDNLELWNNSTDPDSCSQSTQLIVEYKYDNISSLCDDDEYLQTQCKRSCGYCNYNANLPGDECSNNNDCKNDFYTYMGITP